MKIIKTHLEGAKGVWPDELPGVLWAYRTTVRTRTGETPFKLAYGSETVIPAKVHMANHRVTMYQDKDNEEQLRLNLDLINEVRTDVEERTERYKNLMARQHDAMVKQVIQHWRPCLEESFFGNQEPNSWEVKA